MDNYPDDIKYKNSDPITNLTNFLSEKRENGEELNDFMKDVAKILYAASMAKSSLEVIAKRELSTESEPIYAGGVVADNCKIYTAKQVANYALGDIAKTGIV